MALDLFLVRKNGRFLKYDAVEAVSQTGAITAYTSVTGVASTGVVTITGATLADGQQITLTQKTGGSGVATNRVYFAINSSGSTCKLADTIGGSAVSLGTNITAGFAIIQTDEIRVWSSEFRDIFTDENTMRAVPPGTTYPPAFTADTFNAAAAFLPGDMDIVKAASSGTDTFQVVAQSVAAAYSDEKAHQPLRQTFLPRTHWKFDMGSSVSPRYLYAEWQTGDAVAPNPPNTI